MAGTLDSVKSYLPAINLAGIGTFIWWGIIFFLFLIIVGAVFGLWAWWYINKKQFKYNIRIFEKVDGRYKPTINDKAIERKIGTGGDTIFYLKSLKKIVPRPTIQTGINTFWFARREDGELINIGMEDIDLKMKEAQVYYLDNEMRYARASLQKLNKDRNSKETFWSKYGRDIMTIIFVVLISVLLLLIASKMMQIVGTVDNLIKASEGVVDKASTMLGSLDNVCSNSGVTKV